MVSDHSVRRKYRCPQPRCRRIFFARRSVSQHLRTGQCHEWQRTAGLDFSEDSSSDSLTDRDEVEARSYCFRRSHAGATSQSSCRSRRESLVEPCIADSYDERHPRESSTFGCGRCRAWRLPTYRWVVPSPVPTRSPSVPRQSATPMVQSASPTPESASPDLRTLRVRSDPIRSHLIS